MTNLSMNFQERSFTDKLLSTFGYDSKTTLAISIKEEIEKLPYDKTSHHLNVLLKRFQPDDKQNGAIRIGRNDMVLETGSYASPTIDQSDMANTLARALMHTCSRKDLMTFYECLHAYRQGLEDDSDKPGPR